MTRSRVIFLHNRAMDYRVPLFEKLSRTLPDELEFWFYHGGKRLFPGRYFSAVNLQLRLFSRRRVCQFSFSCVGALMMARSTRVLVLNGAGSNYELPFFYAAARHRGMKIAFWTETWDWGRTNWETSLFLKIMRWIAKRADLVLYPGQKVRELYDQCGIPSSKQLFIPNASTNSGGIDQSYIDECLQPAPGKTHIVYLGRIEPRKGLHLLIEAAKLLDPAKYQLLVGGSGSPNYETECRALAGNSSHIRFCGAVIKECVRSFLSVADVYVYPSFNINGMAEPWGLTMNEAVELDKPCVATDAVAAAYDLIDEGKNGFIVPQGDICALARAIEAAANLPRAVVTETCRRKSAAYSYEAMSRGFVAAVRCLT